MLDPPGELPEKTFKHRQVQPDSITARKPVQAAADGCNDSNDVFDRTFQPTSTCSDGEKPKLTGSAPRLRESATSFEIPGMWSM